MMRSLLTFLCILALCGPVQAVDAAPYVAQDDQLADVDPTLVHMLTLAVPGMSVHQRSVAAAALALADQDQSDLERFNRNYLAASTLSVYRPASDTLFSWDGNGWMYDTRTLYTYSAGGRLTEKLVQEWEGNDWINQSRTLNDYDVYGHQSVVLLQFWRNGQWENAERTLHEYDGGGLLSLTTFQEWDATMGEWANVRHLLFMYEAGLLASSTKERWDTDHWIPELRTSYHYGVDDQPTAITDAVYDNGQWNDLLQMTNTYNANGLLGESVSSLWNGAMWLPQSRTTYVYNDSDMETLRTRALFIANSWKPVSSVQSKYENGRIVEVVNINVLLGATVSRRLYSYDDTANAQDEIAQVWLTSDRADGVGEWQNISRTISIREPTGDFCLCPRQGDTGPRSSEGDGSINLIDIVTVVDIAFFGADPSLSDPDCPRVRADVAPLAGCGDGQVDILDVLVLIDYAFSGGPRLCDPCLLDQ